MSHAFGDLLTQYRARKHGLSQTRLAHLTGYDPAVLVRMCQGRKDLTGPSGRDRIIRIIDVLRGEGVLKAQFEANALLEAAGLPPLFAGQPAEAALLAKLDGRPADSTTVTFIHKSNLPHPLTPLIGRDADVALVKQRLALPEVRTLTLIGPPGVGKTRLALQAAAEIAANEDAGEVHFVALAPLSAAAFVLPAIAQALGVIQSPNTALIESVKAAIRGRRMLLLIDNFEHVPDAAPQVAELLAASPLLKVLTTSRTALHISGEHEYVVQPLALQPATDLLIQRAQAVKPSLALDAHNAPAIHAICNRLDRLPLAIELAAARLKLFTPEALMERLAKVPLDVLTHGASDLPARQHTLRRTIDWSYGLLGVHEQAVFRKLGVFAGGFTLAPAETVAGADWETLSSLLDKSLIVDAGEVNGESRFTLLELLREYAQEKLEACGEWEATRRRHAQFVVALAEAAEPHMLTGEQIRWAKRLNSELGNIRAALRWAQERDEYETTMRVIGPTWRYWQTNNHVIEGRAWLAVALAAEPPAPARVLANAYHAAGALALYQYDFQAGLYLHEQGAAWAREAHDDLLIGITLNGCSAACGNLGNVARAGYLAEQSRMHSRETGQKWPHAGALFMLCANALDMGDYVRVFDLGQQSKKIFLEQGDLSWSTAPLRIMAETAVILGEHEQAKQINCEALAIMRKLGVEFLSYNGVCEHLRTTCELAARHSNVLHMARLGGAIEGIYARAGNFAYLDSTQYDMPAAMRHHVEVTGSPVESQTFAAAWDEGRAMTLEQAIDYALEAADELRQLEAQRTTQNRTPA